MTIANMQCQLVVEMSDNGREVHIHVFKGEEEIFESCCETTTLEKESPLGRYIPANSKLN